MNRQLLLRARPEGMVTDECFELVESPTPTLDEGQALVQIEYLSIDPTIRGWISHDTYLPAVPIGDVVRSAGAGHVVESRDAAMPVGTAVFGLTGWQEQFVVGPGAMFQVLPADVDLTDALGVFGTTGVTAYFGMLDVGRPEPGDTVLVSGAAGGTGSIAGQIAKILGCRAIGIAGTPEKCAWIVDELGFDAAIDYRRDDIGARLDELCPQGVDLYFDNVGGPILETVLDHLALNATIVKCGAISEYNDAEPEPGPNNLFNITVQRARMEGFIVLDYLARYPEAIDQLQTWVREGRIKHKVHIVEGFERTPDALRMLFTGQNTGKLLVHLGGDR